MSLLMRPRDIVAGWLGLAELPDYCPNRFKNGLNTNAVNGDNYLSCCLHKDLFTQYFYNDFLRLLPA